MFFYALPNKEAAPKLAQPLCHIRDLRGNQVACKTSLQPRGGEMQAELCQTD